jgi:hypothetical protein
VSLGVTDDGACAGLDVTDGLLRSLADLRDQGNVLPPPSMIVFLRVDGDDLTAPVKDEKRIDGTLLDVLRQLDELLMPEPIFDVTPSHVAVTIKRRP